MNKQDKETLRLTLMAFENNTTNVKNIRIRNMNYLSLDEVQALLNIERKMDDVKSAIEDIILNQFPEGNHLGIINEFEQQSLFNKTNHGFLHDNVD